jgi:hypothetical protein
MDISSYRISYHAAIRWKERTKLSKANEMREFWQKATSNVYEIKLKKKFALKELLNHKYHKAIHYQSATSGWIFVVSGNKKTVLTVLSGDTKRYERS